MGLLDILEGMTNRGGQAASSGRGGISPIAMGLLALLAYKTLKGEGPLGGLFGGQSQASSGNTGTQPTHGGGLLGWLQGELGGALGGGTAGNVINGGLTELLKRLEQNGQGDVGRSWVGSGPNKPVSPADLEKAAGADTLDALAREAGMPRDQLIRKLSQELPTAVDKLTPQGRIPTAQEASLPV
jgi:uncharacterized protein YidB (DUF937 family)